MPEAQEQEKLHRCSRESRKSRLQEMKRCTKPLEGDTSAVPTLSKLCYVSDPADRKLRTEDRAKRSRLLLGELELSKLI